MHNVEPRHARTPIAELKSAMMSGSLFPDDSMRTDPRIGVQKLISAFDAKRAQAIAEEARLEDMTRFEQVRWAKGNESVAGADEVGVGPLAGPVVAAAVILPQGWKHAGIDDSKKLNARQREALTDVIKREAEAWCVASCSVDEIDKYNIFKAARIATRRAVEGLDVEPDHLLVDAHAVPGLFVTQTAIKRGDAQSLSIAAASIIAKVARDAIMHNYDAQYPEFGFKRNQGYPTPDHLSALKKYGPTPIHRRSFEPVKLASEVLTYKAN